MRRSLPSATACCHLCNIIIIILFGSFLGGVRSDPVCTSPGVFATPASQLDAAYVDCITMVGDVVFNAPPNLPLLQQMNGSLTYIDTFAFGSALSSGLANLTIINGALLISASSNVITVSLPLLSYVGSNITYRGMSQLTQVDMPSLTQLGGSVVIVSNVLLTSVNVPLLRTVAGSVVINSNTLLPFSSVIASSLAYVGGQLNVVATPITPVVWTFPLLSYVGASIAMDTTRTRAINLPSLTYMGVFPVFATGWAMLDNITIGTLGGAECTFGATSFLQVEVIAKLRILSIPCVTSITGGTAVTAALSVSIKSNAILVTVDLSRLRSTSSKAGFAVEGNPKLTALIVPQLNYTGSNSGFGPGTGTGIRLVSNEALTNLDSFMNDTSYTTSAYISGGVLISSLTSLQTMRGLSTVSIITGELNFQAAMVLTTINFISLTAVGSIYFLNLPFLTSVSSMGGLQGNLSALRIDLTGITSISNWYGITGITAGGDFIITRNPSLLTITGLRNITGSIRTVSALAASFYITTNPALVTMGGAFAGVTSVTGTWQIADNGKLWLNDTIFQVTSIGATFAITNAAVGHIFFPMLTSVAYNLQISSNSDLATLDSTSFPSLTTIGGGLVLTLNGAPFTAINGAFQSLLTITDINISQNPGVTLINSSFSSLRTITSGAGISISTMTGLVSISSSWSNVTSCPAGILILACTKLVTITDVLPNLNSLMQAFTLTNLPLLTNVSGCYTAPTIRTIAITQVASLVSISKDTFSNMVQCSTISITGATLLRELPSFASLTTGASLGPDIVLTGLTSFTGTIAFPALQTLGSATISNTGARFIILDPLTVSGDIILTQLNGVTDMYVFNRSVHTVASTGAFVTISSNPVMTSILGFNTLPIIYQLQITANPLLRRIDGFASLRSTYGAFIFSFMPLLDTIPAPSFRRLTTIGTSMTLTTLGLANLDCFTNVTRLQGTLMITLMTNLTMIGATGWDENGVENIGGFIYLKQLTTATGARIEISSNPQLRIISGLNQVPYVSVISGLISVLITRNPLLTNITGFNGLTSVYTSAATGASLEISNHASLLSITGFQMLTTIYDQLNLFNNPVLVDISGFRSLRSVSGLFTINGFGVAPINGFPVLTSVGLDFKIEYTNATSITGFNLWRTHQRPFFISNNQRLLNVDGLANLTVGAGTAAIYIIFNTALQNLDGLIGCNLGVGVISISNNAALVSMAGLRRIPSAIGSTIVIASNPVLVDLSGLASVTICNNLLVSNNVGLQSLRGLESLRTLTTTSVSVYPISIDGNGNAASPVLTFDGLTGPFTLGVNTRGIGLTNNGGWISWGNAFVNQTTMPVSIDIIGNHHLSNLSGLRANFNMTGQSTLTVQLNRELRSLSGLACPTLANFFFDSCGNVTSLTGASTKIVTGVMTISYMASLVTFGNTSSWLAINQLLINNNPKLRNMTDFSALKQITVLNLDYNPALVSISGFTAVTAITTSISISNCYALLTLDGFNALTSLPTLSIVGNTVMRTISAFLHATYGRGQITLYNNQALQNIDGFFNLRQITAGGFSISECRVLVSLSGFCNLQSVVGDTLFGGQTPQLCCAAVTDIMDAITVTGTKQLPVPGRTGGCAVATSTCTTANNYTCSCDSLPDMCSPTNLGCVTAVPSYTCDIVVCDELVIVDNPLLLYSAVVGELYANTSQYLYPASFTYQCVQGYRVNGTAAASCNKKSRWNAQPTCVDINECMTGGCDRRATCENSIGSFVCGPVIIPGTLTSLFITDNDDITTSSFVGLNNDFFLDSSSAVTIVDGPSSSILAGSLVSGASYVDMLILVGNQSISSVTYTQTITPFMSHTCLSFNISLLDGNETYANLRCQLDGGHGVKYTFKLSYCGWNTCNSTSGSDLMAFPPPSATSGTLRAITDLNDLDGDGSTSLTLLSNDAGQLLAWNGHNFLNSTGDLVIYFGPAYRKALYTCSVVTLLTTDTRVVCSTQQAYSSGLVITMKQDGYSVELSDSLGYPLNYPVIYRITGCTDQIDNTTVDCPTAGNVNITLYGINFLTPLTIFVSSKTCALVTLVSSTNLVCTLPAGAGFLQGVSMASLDLSSSAALLLSYAAPIITTIIGCSSAHSSLSSNILDITLCNRTGGDILTLVGTNFGASGASVYIGNTACSLVTHDINEPHQLLTCIMPSGNKLNLALVLFQRNGELSTTSISVGYAQCQPGSYEVGLSCVSCSAGRFSLVESVSKCDDCIAGRYTNTSGSISCTDCPLGYIQPSTNATSCISCSPGYYIGSTGKTDCVPCSTGKVNALHGAASCESCLAGKYQDAEANTTCIICPSGRFSNAPERSSCSPCAVGSAVNRTAAIGCDACTAGKYQPTTGQALCLLCDTGKYSEASLATECSPCAMGRYAASNGTNLCDSCSQGYYQAATGQAKCDICKTSIQGAVAAISCDSCSSGLYAGVETCLTCPLQTQLIDGGCICNANYYATISSQSTGEFTCASCPNGAKCDAPGVTQTTLVSAAGWWGYYSNKSESVQFQRCLRTSHCDVGGCAIQRTGPLCALCQNGYEENGDGTCVKCLSSNGQAGRIAGLAIAGAVVLIALIIITLKMLKVPPPPPSTVPSSPISSPSSPSSPISPSTSTTMTLTRKVGSPSILDRSHTVSAKSWTVKHSRKLDKDKMPNYMSRVKVLVSFYQISSSLGNTAGLGWPTHFSSFINAFSFLRLNLMPSSSTTCDTIGYYRQWLILVLVPVAIMIAGSIGFAIYYLWKRNNFTPYDRSLTQAKYWKILLFVQFLFFPGVSSRVIEMFNCITVDGTSYLRADMSLICGDDQWHRYASVAYVYVALWIIGIPLLLFVVVQYLKKRLQEPFILVSLGFLYEAYTTDAPWFELIDVAHKLFQTTLVVLIPSEWQLAMAMLAAVVYLMCILAIDPYTHLLDDALHSLAQVEIMLLLLGGMAWAKEGDTGSDSTDLLLSILLGILFFIIIIFFLHQVWQHGRLLANKHQRNIALLLPSCLVSCLRRCGLLSSIEPLSPLPLNNGNPNGSEGGSFSPNKSNGGNNGSVANDKLFRSATGLQMVPLNNKRAATNGGGGGARALPAAAVLTVDTSPSMDQLAPPPAPASLRGGNASSGSIGVAIAPLPHKSQQQQQQPQGTPPSQPSSSSSSSSSIVTAAGAAPGSDRLSLIGLGGVSSTPPDDDALPLSLPSSST